MIVVSILEAEDFGEELYAVMRNDLTSIIKLQRAGLIIAAGDSRGRIYRLFREMAVEYSHVFFTILLSNDKPAYEEDAARPMIFSLDCNLVYDGHKNVVERRRKMLIDRSDIVICRKKHCNEVRDINKYCDIIVVN